MVMRHCPKCPEDDLAAPARVQRLMESPGYRQTDEDLALLQEPAMRGVRLQLDHWKAENLLQMHGIAHTIVVFGSTRIVEPDAAKRRLDAANAALASVPEDAELFWVAETAEAIWSDIQEWYRWKREPLLFDPIS